MSNYSVEHPEHRDPPRPDRRLPSSRLSKRYCVSALRPAPRATRGCGAARSRRVGRSPDRERFHQAPARLDRAAPRFPMPARQPGAANARFRRCSSPSYRPRSGRSPRRRSTPRPTQRQLQLARPRWTPPSQNSPVDLAQSYRPFREISTGRLAKRSFELGSRQGPALAFRPSTRTCFRVTTSISAHTPGGPPMRGKRGQDRPTARRPR